LKEEVFDDTSRFKALSAVLNSTRQTNSSAQLLYPHVRYLPNAHKEHSLEARPKGHSGPAGRWVDFGNGFGLYLGDANKRMVMETHKQLDTFQKVRKAKYMLSRFSKDSPKRGVMLAAMELQLKPLSGI
jgi:hypothetical protein